MASPLGEDRVQLNHLYLRVRDLERSRGFYERYFGFDAGPAEWQAETFVVRNEVGFALALTPDPEPPEWPAGLHIGFLVEDTAFVRRLHDRMNADGVSILESFFEPGFALFKCRDPDGCVIEVEAGAPGVA